jgi:beta-N-acetylhexosaminidase
VNLTLAQAVGMNLLAAFSGKQEPPPSILDAVQQGMISGVTLFRDLNVDTPEELSRLTGALQRAARAAGQPPLVIAADQEGGQLNAVAGATLFPGNMALGAIGSTELAQRVGLALGRELAAVGINVDYAPVCDVNIHPKNPETGIRSFGESPELVARLAAAMVKGLQSAGVAATAKHFPGNGNAESDSHHGMPVASADVRHLREVELPPFQAAIQAGVRLVMAGHASFPAMQAGRQLPASLSSDVLRGWLRKELGYTGVIVTDAMNMKAIHQGPGGIQDAMAAIAAGADLLLLTAEMDYRNIYEANLREALQEGALSEERTASAARVMKLREWLAAGAAPPLDVVGCLEHRQLAAEIADRSITLVRDDNKRLPLRLTPQLRLAAIMPQPRDLTPADTSSYVPATLGAVLRIHHPQVSEFIVSQEPTPNDIAGLRDAVRDFDLVVVGSINAFTQPAQADMVNAILQTGVPTIVAALRHPADLAAFPSAPTFLCTYGILEPTLQALANALWGKLEARGRLPVSIPGLYPVGHGMGKE